MKIFFLAIPFTLGALAVLQGALNRSVGLKYGWPVTGMMNNAFGFLFAFAVASALFFFFGGRGVAKISDWQWWYAIPGCLGMLFVMGVPLSMQQIGASRTFVILVASQILFGLLWDWMSSVPLSGLRVAGVALALAGALLAGLS